jgi:putative tricarboxylic transport membrane protein
MSGRLGAVLAGLVFLLVGSAQVWLSLRLPNGLGLSAAEPGPGLFPALVGALMCLAATAHLVQSWRAGRGQAQQAHGAPIDIVLLVLAIAGYILLLPRAGFAVSAFALLLCSLSIYGMPGLWRRVGTAAVATAVAYLVFTKGLGVNMPAATWFN